MTHLLGSLFSSVSSALELNKSTLSGTIDVIVVNHPERGLVSTPFHVRYGKLMLLRSKEKIVRIRVNGSKIDPSMILDTRGIAYFLEDNKNDQEIELSPSKHFSPLNTSSNIPHQIQSHIHSSRTNQVRSLSADYNTVNHNNPDNLDTSDFSLTSSINNTISNESSKYVTTNNTDNITSDLITTSPKDNNQITNQNKNESFKCLSDNITSDLITTSPKDNNQITNQQLYPNESSQDYTLKTTNMELSLCGPNLPTTLDQFKQYIISWETFNSEPHLLFSSRLIIRFGKQFYPTTIGLPLLISWLTYHKPLTQSTISILEKNNTSILSNRKIKKRKSKKHNPNSNSSDEEAESDDVVTSSSEEDDDTDDDDSDTDSNDENKTNNDDEIGDNDESTPIHLPGAKPTLYPSDQTLRLFNLREGMNQLTFTVKSHLQGSRVLVCHVYLWNSLSKIVITDVDGTITRSDVLGNILPVFGADWAHSGVVNFFSRLSKNGYKVIYLTSRAISQATATRGYINCLRQDEESMPEGPILMNPVGLAEAFKKEVIQHVSHDFKISVLNVIMSLFPEEVNPFYAGFGNSDTDILSYNSLGISRNKIFIINPSGLINVPNSPHEMMTYSRLSQSVDDMFPNYDTKHLLDPQFNTFNYWKNSSNIILRDLS